MPDHLIVTGAGGWLGRSLLAHLHAHDPREVRALVGRADEVPLVREVHPGAQVFVGDIADPEPLRRALAGTSGASVLHTAGVIHPAKVADFERVNLEGTRTVLETARDAGVRRVVHVSSNSAFGVNPTPTDVFRAEEPFRPYMGYGRSKMLAEQFVRTFEGVETVVVRPPWFYGPHQPDRQSTFFTLVRTGRFPLLGKGENRRSMVYTPSLADAVARAERVDAAAGRAYWIADERPYPMSEVVDTVREACRLEGLDVKPQRVRLPAFVGGVAERIDGLLQSKGIYHQEFHVLGEMDKTIAVDVSRAREELGWEPPASLLDGMRASVRWCLDRGLEL